MDPRRRARTLALQALCEADLSDHLAEEVLERLAARGLESDAEDEDALEANREDRPEPAQVTAFARELVAGVQANRAAIDGVIAETAPQFPVREVAVVDRNVLRQAIFEVLFDTKTPVRAAVNEAVELAKTFGSDSSARFVNGVLGTVAARATR